MNEMTASIFEEARRQLFDPTVEDEDIQRAEANIRRAEEMYLQSRSSITDSKELKALKMTLEERIKSQKKWIRTLKKIQGQKVRRLSGIRKLAM
jgi:hypothetical protein